MTVSKTPVTGVLLRVARRGKITDGGDNPSKTITIIGL
jgi:hypothetical protein